MQTPALQLAETYRLKGKPERLSWGVAELQVTDLGRAVSFWTVALGLQERETLENGAVVLGTRSRPLVILHRGARTPVIPGHAGMYHIAIGVPDQAEFSRSLARLIDSRISFSPVDHTMSKAIYLNEPDGHGIEIAYETPHRFSSFVKLHRGFGVIDAAGQLRTGRDSLDMQEELSHLPATDLYGSISDGAFLAHLNLNVPELEPAIVFFEQIGFARNLTLPALGFADLGAGGAYTHRVALNAWHGMGIRPAPEESARLLHYTLHTSDQSVFEAASTQLGKTSSSGKITVTDPSQVPVTLNLDAKNISGQRPHGP